MTHKPAIVGQALEGTRYKLNEALNKNIVQRSRTDAFSNEDLEMVLAGTLNEYAFSLLLEILLEKRETGLLEISTSNYSGHFYVKNGEIKGAELGDVSGPAAVQRARTLVEGFFKFKQLEPTDYAQAVWAKNFGPNIKVTYSFIGRESLRTLLTGVVAYPEAVCVSVVRAAVRLPSRALPLLMSYTKGAWCELAMCAASVGRRTTGRVAAIVQLSKTLHASRKSRELLHQLPANWRFTPHHDTENFQLVNSSHFWETQPVGRSRESRLSREEVAFNNTSLPNFNASTAGRKVTRSVAFFDRVGMLTKQTADCTIRYLEVSKKTHDGRRVLRVLKEAFERWRVAISCYYERILPRARALNSKTSLTLIRQKLPFAHLQELALNNGVLRQLGSNATVAGADLHKLGVSLVKRSPVRIVSVFSKRVQIVLATFRKEFADGIVGGRLAAQVIFNRLNRRNIWAFIRARLSTLPSLQQVVQSNISFGLVLGMLLCVITVSLNGLLHSKSPPADAFLPSQALPSQVSGQNRVKRKPTSRAKRYLRKRNFHAGVNL